MINLVPLEIFLSCFKCQQTGGVDIKPFLFLSFEDFLYYSTGTEFKPSINSSITMKNPPHLDDY